MQQHMLFARVVSGQWSVYLRTPDLAKRVYKKKLYSIYTVYYVYWIYRVTLYITTHSQLDTEQGN